jgi:mRNA interferase MazF
VKRGNIVIVSAPGSYGKPRPAVIVQSDLFNETHASILVALITSELMDAPLFRLDVEPSEKNGLTKPSQIMADKIVALKKESITQNIGNLDEDIMIKLNRSLALFLGIGT